MPCTAKGQNIPKADQVEYLANRMHQDPTQHLNYSDMKRAYSYVHDDYNHHNACVIVFFRVLHVFILLYGCMVNNVIT